MAAIPSAFPAAAEALAQALRLEASFDLVCRTVQLSARTAKVYFTDGLCQKEQADKVVAALCTLPETAFADAGAALPAALPHLAILTAETIEDFCTAVLSGAVGCLIEDCSRLLLTDLRLTPTRSVAEPENDRVLRGPHDGFVEALTVNTGLVRRKLRDPLLTMELHQIGTASKTDVVLCFHAGHADPKQLATVRQKLAAIRPEALTMGQASLIECLVPKQWYNPFPKVRYTERPDATAAAVLEGRIVILIDHSPSAMIIPAGIFDFLQDTNDYYLSPVIGSYLRVARMLIFALTLLLIPVWYLLIDRPDWIPAWLDFIRIEHPNTVPIAAQLLIVELVIDAMRLASNNTPNALSSSFGVVGTLVLGEFAVTAGWFVPEVVLYMAFVAMTNFTQPSFELGYAFKLFRMLLIVLTALLHVWGFAAGICLLIIEIATTKTVTGQCYLYPLLPFHPRALLHLLLRLPLPRRERNAESSSHR
ncbi:MAG: spore germination protein [Clostridia bacterium]|nr:spore germination protein [Clostridia bacterium]